MKHVVLMSALALAMSSFGAANAQNAAAVVSSTTSDATTRAVTDAVGASTQDALRTGRKTRAIEKTKTKARTSKGAYTAKSRTR